MNTTVTAVISRCALRHNLQQLRKITPNSKLIAVVKANAYGHGLLETVKTLTDADAFGVARLDEALRLCDNGIKKPILLLGGFFSIKDLSIIVTERIQTTVHNIEQLKALEMAKLNRPITVWMKLDTGMHRLGVRLDQAEMFYYRLKNCKNVQQPVNIISHFSHINNPKCSVIEQQLNNFNTFCDGKKGLRSIAASGGILFYPKSHLDYIRPGIILYGISPLEEGGLYGESLGFKPVMSLTSSLIAVRKHKAGEAVGYDGTWVSKRDTLLGVVAIGYGDGYPRSAPSGTPVIINNREVKIVGRVAMDMICVDLGPKARDKAGDSVILWGNNLPVERISKITSTSTYELITRLTSRVAMNYID